MLLPRVVGIFSLGMLGLGAGMVFGQTYPNKPIRIFTAEVGGSGDLVARLIAQGISGPLGQPVIVDNRFSVIAAETVAKAAPDGHTLLVISNFLWAAPLMQSMSFDPVRDFLPVSLAVSAPNFLVVHPSLPIKSVKELVALAKARPGELNYGTSGTGTTNHFAAELFKALAGINIVRVNYKGGGPLLNALLGGEVQLTFNSAGAVMPHIKSGRLRALAVSSAQRSALFPELPTVAATLPGYETGGASALYAPAGTPAAIVNRLNREVVKVLNQADVKEKFLSVGTEVVASSPEQLTAKVKAEMARLGKVVKDAGLRVE